MSRRILLILGVIILVLGVVVSSALFTVHQTEQALVLQFGEPRTLHTEPGLKMKTPFLQDVRYFEKRVLNLDPPVERMFLKGQKPLLVDSYLRYRISDPLKFLQSLGNETQLQDRLTRLNNGAIRENLGDVELVELLSEKRQSIMATIRDQVSREAKRFGIDVLDVRIRRADLPDEIGQAIYARMRSDREKEAAQFRAEGFETALQIRAKADKRATVIRAEAEKDAQILRGEGDAIRTRMLGQAYGKAQEFFDFYRSMQAYREALQNDDTTLILSPDSEFFRFFGDLSGETPGKEQ